MAMSYVTSTTYTSNAAASGTNTKGHETDRCGPRLASLWKWSCPALRSFRQALHAASMMAS